MRGENEQGSVDQLVRDGDFLDVAAEVRLVPVSQRLVHLLELLELFLGNLVIVENLDIVLRDALDLSLLVLAEVLGGELVNGVVEDEHLVALIDVL